MGPSPTTTTTTTRATTATTTKTTTTTTTTPTTTTTITSTWGHTVLSSARVFMRRQPIPPLCGGAVQALPNFQTTLRHHPHPASRPMTFGHFTSWPADDLGYYTGAWVRRRRRRRRRDDARMWPAWYFLQGIVAPGRRANVIEGVRGARESRPRSPDGQEC